jgi:hypothetical protein
MDRLSLRGDRFELGGWKQFAGGQSNATGECKRETDPFTGHHHPTSFFATPNRQRDAKGKRKESKT